MGELEDLIEQRKEINKRIKQLQDECKIIGCVKLDRFQGWGIQDGYQVYLFTYSPIGYKKYKSIIQAQTKEEIIAGIDLITQDLARLKNRLHN